MMLEMEVKRRNEEEKTREKEEKIRTKVEKRQYPNY